MNDFELKVWHLNPQSIRLLPAEKTLSGFAHPDGVKFCGPFTSANKYGFWVFPPVDVDFILHEDDTFEHNTLSPWENDEVPIMRKLLRPTDLPDHQTWIAGFDGRMKVDCGRVEKNICQIWTGCVFQTPPGWSLMIRSPININMNVPYRIQEGILETDWLTYDIWMNVAVQRKEEWIKLRRDQWPPLAQLVPVPRDAYDKQWTLKDEMINRNSDEGNKIYTGWCDYNYKKYLRMRDEKTKDSATYHKERRRVKKEASEPKMECPFKQARVPKATPKRLIPSRKDEK